MSQDIKERPILFQGAMVRALLDGSKTQTRRLVKGFALELLAPDNFTTEFVALPENRNCPYGYAGDRLWVRESFWGCDMSGYGDQPCVVYDDEWHGKEYAPAEARPWARKFGRIPSIHMPQDCSRITLEITGVRVERLQDISEADAVAEGIRISSQARRSDACYGIYECQMPNGKTHFNDSAYNLYRALWEQINGPGSWDANPWVWAVEFRRIKP